MHLMLSTEKWIKHSRWIKKNRKGENQNTKMQTLKVIFTIFSRYAINVSIKLIISFTSYCKTTCLGSNRQNEFINRVISLDFNDSCVFSPSLLAIASYARLSTCKHLTSLIRRNESHSFYIHNYTHFGSWFYVEIYFYLSFDWIAATFAA